MARARPEDMGITDKFDDQQNSQLGEEWEGI